MSENLKGLPAVIAAFAAATGESGEKKYNEAKAMMGNLSRADQYTAVDHAINARRRLRSEGVR